MKTAKAAISLALIALMVAGCNSTDGQSANTEGRAADVYAQIAPLIVFIDTPTGTGSGIYIDGGYILTCAHVAWPFLLRTCASSSRTAPSSISMCSTPIP